MANMMSTLVVERSDSRADETVDNAGGGPAMSEARLAPERKSQGAEYATQWAWSSRQSTFDGMDWHSPFDEAQ